MSVPSVRPGDLTYIIKETSLSNTACLEKYIGSIGKTAKWAHLFMLQAALVAGLCTQGFISLTVYSGRSFWGFLLSSDPVVVERISHLLPFLAIMIPADGANAAYAGKFPVIHSLPDSCIIDVPNAAESVHDKICSLLSHGNLL